jgi:hypothetical protein
MTTVTLRVAVFTPTEPAPWQEHCRAALAAVPGVELVDPTSDSGAAHDPVDVLVDLRPTPAQDGPAPAANEVWRLRFGPERSPDPVAASLRRYARGRTVMRAELIREADGCVLRDGLLEPGSWWAPAQLARVLLAPAGWPAAVAAERLATGPAGGAAVPTAAVADEPAHDRAVPSVPRAALLGVAVARRLAGSLDGLVTHDDWHIGIVDAPIERFLEPGPPPPIAWLRLRPGHFAADPFGVERDGRLHVFYEDFDQRGGIGTIHHVAIEADGSLSEPRLVIDAGVHASYPFLLEDDGNVYLLPEIGASGELVLYEATDFPDGWRPAATLLPGVPALDASIVRFEDRWWLFATRLDRGANHDLFIWHADALRGPWHEHAGNPVESDIRSARPGGTPFIVDGVLYRPSQDDSGVYGGRLVVNRVLTLSPTEFREEPARIVSPDPAYPDGLHTLSAAGGRTLVDGNHRHLVPGAFRRVGARQVASVRRRLTSR